jgi:hypothetical protein
MSPVCANGHVRTEANTRYYRDNARNRVRIRCLDCRKARYVPKEGPTAAEQKQMATTHAHEDIEDLLSYGASYEEIIKRVPFSSWNKMQRSLKRRGRQDLLDALYAKKEAAA